MNPGQAKTDNNDNFQEMPKKDFWQDESLYKEIETDLLKLDYNHKHYNYNLIKIFNIDSVLKNEKECEFVWEFKVKSDQIKKMPLTVESSKFSQIFKQDLTDLILHRFEGKAGVDFDVCKHSKSCCGYCYLFETYYGWSNSDYEVYSYQKLEQRFIEESKKYILPIELSLVALMFDV